MSGARDLTGETFDGRYRIESRVGKGGMGSVWRAIDVRLSRPVAVKVMNDRVPDELAARQRFAREAAAMSKLAHPNCASILDTGVHDGAPYVVMDLVAGESLEELVARGPLPVERAVDIVRQMLFGLAHAHECGIVHRDIKPANVVLSRKAGVGDHVKLLDFGLAKLGGSDAGSSSPGSTNLTAGFVVGTPSYMAPEQVRGQPLDARADLYACGCVLFELLTGGKPFRAATDDPLAICLMHVNSPAPTLAERRPGVAFGGLEAIVARALAKDREARFPSAVAFADALAGTGEAAETQERMRPAPPSTYVLSPPPPVHAATAALPAPAAAATTALRAPTPRGAVSGVDATMPLTPSDSALSPAGSAALSPAGTPSEPVLLFPPKRPRETAPPPMSRTPTPNPGAALTAMPVATMGPSSTMTPSAGVRVPPRRSSGAMMVFVLLAAAGVVAAIAIAVMRSHDDAPTLPPPTAPSPPPAAPIAGDQPQPPAPAPAKLPPPPTTTEPAKPPAVAGTDDDVATTIGRALTLAAKGAHKEGIALLLKARKAYPKDARLPYRAGLLYMEKMWTVDGLPQLRAAIALDPAYRSDPDLIKAVIRAFNATAGYDGTLGAFLHVTIGAPARPYVEDTAKSHPNPIVRARATAELRRIPTS